VLGGNAKDDGRLDFCVDATFKTPVNRPRRARKKHKLNEDDKQMDNLFGDPISNPVVLRSNKEPLIRSYQSTKYPSLGRKSACRRPAADDTLDFDGQFYSRTRSQSEMYDSDNMLDYMSYQGTPRGSYMSPSLEASDSISQINDDVYATDDQ
jgi:hypothetical protein